MKIKKFYNKFYYYQIILINNKKVSTLKIPIISLKFIEH